jgi:hypothetical protein
MNKVPSDWNMYVSKIITVRSMQYNTIGDAFIPLVLAKKKRKKRTQTEIQDRR